MAQRLIVLLIFVLILAGAASAQDDISGTPEEICQAAVPAAEPETRTYQSAEFILAAGVDYRAVFCTESGPVYIDLLEDYTPTTVNNFVFLAQNGYYNNTTFHRVLEDFMAQAGDPTGTGSGGPGYQFLDEFIQFLNFDRPGLLAMANAGPNTNGSQFFITTAETPWLNQRHTIFGEVLEGQENVLALKLRDPGANPDFEGAKLETVVIITDPSRIHSGYKAIESAFKSLIDNFNDQLTPDAETSGRLTTEEVLSSTPEEVIGDYSTFLSNNTHQYRYTQSFSNGECNPEIPFSVVRYTLDVFENPIDIAAVLEGGVLFNLAVAEGFSDAGTLYRPYPMFSKSAVDCAGKDAVHGRLYVKRGRYLVTAEIIFPLEVIPSTLNELQALSILLNEVVLGTVFEPFVGTLFSGNLR